MDGMKYVNIKEAPRIQVYATKRVQRRENGTEVTNLYSSKTSYCTFIAIHFISCFIFTLFIILKIFL